MRMIVFDNVPEKNQAFMRLSIRFLQTFTLKHLRWIFFGKRFIKKRLEAGLFQYCKMFKNSFFYRNLQLAAFGSQCISLSKTWKLKQFNYSG